ncbi:MAG: GHKL domain-containing protein [Oscillospiraceae bacterium]|nr:GHKL domain-containing protein [Oscillospiraceae bacterium]
MMLMTILSSLIIVYIIFLIIEAGLSIKIGNLLTFTVIGVLLVIYIIIILFIPIRIAPEIIIGISILFATATPLFASEQIVKGQLVYFAMLAFGMVSVITGAVLWIAKVDITISPYAQAIDLFICIIIMILCIIAAKKGILSRMFSSISLLQKHMKVILIIAIWVSAFIAMLFAYLTTTYSGLPGYAYLGALVAILIIIIGVMCPLLILSSLSRTRLKTLSDAMDKQIQAQVIHYDFMIKMNEDIRRFQHDYMNLRLGLEKSLMHNDIEGALKHLQSDEMSVAISTNSYNTGSVILDALLHEKYLTADTVNTTIEFEGIIPSNLLSTAEICIIFGNALDNAIEACAKCEIENKTIVVKTTHSRKFLFIKIENPTASDVKIINNTIVTTKKDKLSHGIGLRSIQTAIKKYSGKMELSCENNEFCIEIDLDFNINNI